MKDKINKIANRHAQEYMKEFEDECIDLVVTSPPYDELRTYNDDSTWNYQIFTEIADQLYRVMKQGGIVVWVVGDQTKQGGKTLSSFRQALYFQEIGFNMYDIIIYEKTGTGPPHKNRYFNAYEFMFVLSKGKPKTVNLLRDKLNKWGGHTTFGKVTRREKDGTLTNKGRKTVNEYGVRTNIWKYCNGKGFSTKDTVAYKHPAIFPEKLVEDHILTWSNKGDLILDPFAGSGTTGKIAKQLDRDWILIEVSKEYYKIAGERLGVFNNENDCN